MSLSPGLIRKEIRLNLVINVLLLLSALGGIAIGALIFFKSERFTKGLTNQESADMTESIVRILGVIGGITSAVYVGQGLHFTVQKAKEDYEYLKTKDEEAKLQRISETSLQRLNELTTQWITLVPATDVILRKIRELEKLHGKDNLSSQREAIRVLMEDTSLESLTFYTSSKTLLDFVELISVSVLNGSLDENDTFQYFAVVVVRLGDLYKDWIIDHQDLKNRKLAYQPLLELYKRWDTRVP